MTLQTTLSIDAKPEVVVIDKTTCDLYVKQFHYLKDRGSLASVRHGLVINRKIVGVSEWKPPCGPWLIVGAFGLSRNCDQTGFFELGRFVLSENAHNRASMFLAASMKLLKQKYNPKAIFTFADSRFHTGIIYQATNWKYYGLTEQWRDRYIDGKKDTGALRDMTFWRRNHE